MSHEPKLNGTFGNSVSIFQNYHFSCFIWHNISVIFLGGGGGGGGGWGGGGADLDGNCFTLCLMFFFSEIIFFENVK